MILLRNLEFTMGSKLFVSLLGNMTRNKQNKLT